MEARLSFNACHIRCVTIAADSEMKLQFTTVPSKQVSDLAVACF